jgi:hypothetical protein
MRFAVGVLGVIILSGCTKEEQAKVGSSVKSAYEDSRAAMAKAWDSVKDYTFDKRDEFNARTNAITAEMDVQISEMRANFADAIASASRKAAMEELKNAEADYKDKLRALASATADTWESAKNNLILAWNRLQAAYYKARADLSRGDVVER